jgi:hypothetical protein
MSGTRRMTWSRSGVQLIEPMPVATASSISRFFVAPAKRVRKARGSSPAAA